MENIEQHNGKTQAKITPKPPTTTSNGNGAAGHLRIRPRVLNQPQIVIPKKNIGNGTPASLPQLKSLVRPVINTPGTPNRGQPPKPKGGNAVTPRPRPGLSATSQSTGANSSSGPKTQITKMKVGSIEIEVVRTASQVIYRLPGNKSVNTLTPEQLKLVMDAINRMHAQRNQTANSTANSSSSTPARTAGVSGSNTPTGQQKVARSSRPTSIVSTPTPQRHSTNLHITPRPGNARIAPKSAAASTPPAASPAPSPGIAPPNAAALALLGSNPQALAQRLLSLQNAQNAQGGGQKPNIGAEKLLSLLTSKLKGQQQAGALLKPATTGIATPPSLSIQKSSPSMPGSGAQTPINMNHSQTVPTTPTSSTQQNKRRYVRSGKYSSKKKSRSDSPGPESAVSSKPPSPTKAAPPMALSPQTTGPVLTPNAPSTLFDTVQSPAAAFKTPQILPRPPSMSGPPSGVMSQMKTTPTRDLSLAAKKPGMTPIAPNPIAKSTKKLAKPRVDYSRNVIPFVHSYITKPSGQVLDFHANRLISRFQAVLKADHDVVSSPNIDTPFQNHTDMVQRLLPYHVYQYPESMLEPPPNFEQDCKESGQRLHESEALLIKKFNSMRLSADMATKIGDDDSKLTYHGSMEEFAIGEEAKTYSSTDLIDHIELEMLRVEVAQKQSDEAEDEWQSILQARFNKHMSTMAEPTGTAATSSTGPSSFLIGQLGSIYSNYHQL
ncbi:hypothetical protein H4219_004207 [Mycoemilia scoparia]|uniref:GLTSCR protein conserved domain-containing protein n=1 Tax=Mycoemilia scoparia TaxID=417184 RepID=A0A9W8A1W0_9FUNG|nr:hypothetical protein H4219_004207 [Mycoemilia scoparia]